MGQIIDTSIWVDHLCSGTPEATRRLADAVINDPDALLCEPVRFELLAGVAKRQRPLLLRRLETMPLLATSPALWNDASNLAADACDAGIRVASVDLLIAALCIHHNATLITFDSHFEKLATLSKLRVNLLVRVG